MGAIRGSSTDTEEGKEASDCPAFLFERSPHIGLALSGSELHLKGTGRGQGQGQAEGGGAPSARGERAAGSTSKLTARPVTPVLLVSDGPSRPVSPTALNEPNALMLHGSQVRTNLAPLLKGEARTGDDSSSSHVHARAWSGEIGGGGGASGGVLVGGMGAYGPHGRTTTSGRRASPSHRGPGFMHS
jgi:hypothetical protein